MSSVFRKSTILGALPKRKKPDIPAQQAEPEQIETVTEDATEAGRRKRKHLATAGTQTRLSGIRSTVLSALKKRLGE